MDVAHLPSTAENSAVLETRDRFEEAIADKIAAGKMPATIAREVYPHDGLKRKRLRNRIRNMIYNDSSFPLRVAKRIQLRQLVALGPATEGLARRAGRGDVQATKLLYEASGFHNPRVKHDHSGSIEVKLTMPRPERPEPVDAEVVEDSS